MLVITHSHLHRTYKFNPATLKHEGLDISGAMKEIKNLQQSKTLTPDQINTVNKYEALIRIYGLQIDMPLTNKPRMR